MVAYDYTYMFSPISDLLCEVQLINHRTGKHEKVRVAAQDQHLNYQVLHATAPQLADLVDLGLAVYMADRFSKREANLPCRIHVTLPMRVPDLFNHPKTLQLLRDALYSYTDDNWSFSFEHRMTEGRPSEQQMVLHLPFDNMQITEVALWSGGLDSFAGLWQRANSHPEVRYVLLGTGPNNFILHRQRKLLRYMHRSSSTNFALVQIPLSLRTPYRMYRNRYQRTRGFVFLLLGVVCAYLQGQRTLYIYENGIGALNLSFREAEIGLDHARAVHPLSLLKMKDLVSHLLQEVFTFANPFLFQTKAEICAPLQGSPIEQFVHQTISCDSRPRLAGRPSQCGGCSSCLLRRQALAASGIVDQTGYHKKDLISSMDCLPFEAMLTQLELLRTCFASTDPWIPLRTRYPNLVTVIDRLSQDTGEPSELLIAQLLRLYKQYIQEWDYAQSVFDTSRGHLAGQIA